MLLACLLFLRKSLSAQIVGRVAQSVYHKRSTHESIFTTVMRIILYAVVALLALVVIILTLAGV